MNRRLFVPGVLVLALSCNVVMAGEQQRDEAYRPQFHFTPDRGWMNDPNGLVYDQGEYHLFFQHNVRSTNWVSDLTWGHAVSRDLLHWEQLPEAVHPLPIPGGKTAGAWSGSGLIDFNNSAGFQTGGEKPIVVVWTAAGLGQCIAYSNDRGRTFTPYAHNPVIPMDPPRNGDWDRDPKVYWHAPTGKWVMAFSVSGKGVVFYNSSDLKHWTYQGAVPDLFECPDYFELPVDGNARQTKWIVWDASGKYFIGRFDGHAFARESGPFMIDYGHNYYAAQTWNNAPDGRRIGIAWMRDGRYPDMPFNQQMSVPFELKLRTTPDGLRLTRLPVKEIDGLRYGTRESKDLPLGSFKQPAGELLDIEAEIEPRGASAVVMRARGATIRYVPGLLRCQDFTAPLRTENGRITLRVLVDRTSIEVFANQGESSISATFLPHDSDRDVELHSEGGQARLVSIRLHKLHSIWQSPTKAE